MAGLTHDDFLNVYKEISQNSGSEISKIRKTILLKHSTAINTLDNRNACLLLNDNLKEFKNKILVKENEISRITTKNNFVCQRKCNLDKNCIDSMITNLPCSNKPICDKSENITEEYFQDFLTLFHEKHVKDNTADQKQRTFAKNFTPQTCNTKTHFIKQFKENTKIEKNESNAYNNQSEVHKASCFKTAREELNVQKKQSCSYSNSVGQKRKLGTRRGVGSKFVSPMLSNESNEDSSPKSQEWVEQITDDRLKNTEPRMIELIKSEIMDSGPPIDWNDIAGLEFAKTAIQEAVVWPILRPDIFTGLRRPPKGILLFGPPGTGKTLIGKCVASQSKSTFFSISASSLTSKWVGDGEKMVRALFTVARCHQPAVIFIDEIDSLLSQRSDTEHESSRRIKTEFLVQLDGATTDSDEKILVIGATNRPQELDEAARRRFVKRLYIPLPEFKARQQLVQRLMLNEKHQLNDENIMEIAKLSDGYSGADMRTLCADASMGPIRAIDMNLIHSIQTTEVRPVDMDDFRKALTRVKSSVSPKDLEQYVTWDKTYGSGNLC